jgi:hypothetical protein
VATTKLSRAVLDYGGAAVNWKSKREDSVTVTLTFGPEIEAGLLARAQARGMALQDYVRRIVEQDALPSGQDTVPEEPAHREEAVRRMLEFGDKYRLSLGEPVTRELLHEGHRY